MPEQIAIVHIWRYQKGTTLEIRGNNLADLEAKNAAEAGEEKVVMILTPMEKFRMHQYSVKPKKRLSLE